MKKIAFWLKFSVFNLFIVSLLGVLMRYKIAFSFPILDQKHMQEAHSHFAFYGWITTVLYVFLLDYLLKNNGRIQSSKYYSLIFVNIISSFGMLFSFIYGGYFWLSILFSTVSILVTFIFSYFFYRDSLAIKDRSKTWFLGALFFALLSSLGVFLLAYMNVNHEVSQTLYLASTYYYLHFQYNGFFIFSCIGFLLFLLKEIGAEISEAQNKLIFWCSFVGCVIGFGLSVLYLDLGKILFTTIFLGSLVQTFGAVLLISVLKKNWSLIKNKWSPFERFVLLFVGLSFIIKILLQLLSNIPAINQFAYGFRNVVIAYLHLVLLVCISSFLLGKIVSSGYFQPSKKLILGLKIFLLGIFLNELVLGLMALFSTAFISVPYSAEILVLVSVLIMISLIIIRLNLKNQKKDKEIIQ